MIIKSNFGRVGAFVVTMGVSVTLVGLAAHATGAYFSDSKAGTISGTLGSIKVTGGGGNGANNLDFQFTNMLPGVAQTANGGFQNTGRNNEDVWIVFNAPALHALNVLGHYGEIHVDANGGEIFASQNLNDDTASCPPGVGSPPCAALPAELKLASNVAPTNGGSFSFSFNYPTKLSGPNLDAAPGWNCYPVVGPNKSAACDPNASNSYGLPYQIVATQVGVTPGS